MGPWPPAPPWIHHCTWLYLNVMCWLSCLLHGVVAYAWKPALWHRITGDDVLARMKFYGRASIATASEVVVLRKQAKWSVSWADGVPRSDPTRPTDCSTSPGQVSSPVRQMISRLRAVWSWTRDPDLCDAVCLFMYATVQLLMRQWTALWVTDLQLWTNCHRLSIQLSW